MAVGCGGGGCARRHTSESSGTPGTSVCGCWGWSRESADPRAAALRVSPPSVRTRATAPLVANSQRTFSKRSLLAFGVSIPPGLAGAYPRAAVTTYSMRSLLPVVCHFGTCLPVLLLEHVVVFVFAVLLRLYPQAFGPEVIPPFDRTNLSWSLSTP